jgi:hypothetical protein
MALDITAHPAEIVFFQMGNLGARSKTYKPYLDAYRHAVKTYPVVSSADVIYDNGGQQSGMHEVILEELKQDAGGETIYGNPQDMTNSMKYQAANWLIDLLRKGALVMPELRILIRQVSNWTLPDKKLAQDAAMTLFMLVNRAYYIISDRGMGYGVEQQAPDFPMDGDGHAAWDYPEDIEVLHDIEEVTYA